jgi:diguanylate cyclase (GGDEF)-like protein/PAS domain S-box-containing protein
VDQERGRGQSADREHRQAATARPLPDGSEGSDPDGPTAGPDADRYASRMATPRTPRAQGITPLGLSAEAVLDASPDAVLAVDGRGRIVYANPKVQELGWSPEELRGEPIECLVPLRETERHAELRAAYHRQPTPRPMGIGLELAARRRDGTEFPVEISLAPVRSRRGPLVFATVVDITTRTNLQARLEQVHEELQRHADELEQRGREMSHLAEMGELLESCQSLDEAYAVIARVAEPLFAGDAGAVYALTETGTAAEIVAAWGNPPPSRSVFAPSDCWALRRGRLHVVHDTDPDLRCSHVEESTTAGLLCQPLAAQTETLGLLHVQLRRRAPTKVRAGLLANRQRLVETLGKQVALAIANIRLRETLWEQSSRDSLTGLFNRRYMEESLDREIRRAAREGYGVGILMADLDHFKDLNDAFGHAAGDEVLRRIGRFLAGAVRGEDIPCRFGGEEFVVLLPKASLEDTHRRAEALREGIKVHPVDGPTRLYPIATMSVGVAAYPGHGTTVEELILAADSAMYRAKAQGRDRVVVAGGHEGRPIEVSAG